jgi:hypothetical protein
MIDGQRCFSVRSPRHLLVMRRRNLVDQIMASPALIGILMALGAVVAAYWMGHGAGFQAGQDAGFNDGKREGTKEGSMRGYAVGFDRGRRRESGEEADEAHRAPGIGFGVAGLLFAAVATFFLASKSRQQTRLKPRPVAASRQVSEAPQQVPFAGQPLESSPNERELPPIAEPQQDTPNDRRLVPVPPSRFQADRPLRPVDARPVAPAPTYPQRDSVW